MTSESTVKSYHKLLTDCFDARQERFGLHNKKGLLVADAFTGNFGRSSGALT